MPRLYILVQGRTNSLKFFANRNQQQLSVEDGSINLPANGLLQINLAQIGTDRTRDTPQEAPHDFAEAVLSLIQVHVRVAYSTENAHIWH